jgi:hypothetical protein
VRQGAIARHFFELFEHARPFFLACCSARSRCSLRTVMPGTMRTMPLQFWLRQAGRPRGVYQGHQSVKRSHARAPPDVPTTVGLRPFQRFGDHTRLAAIRGSSSMRRPEVVARLGSSAAWPFAVGAGQWTLPVRQVFGIGNDPVELGLIASLNFPDSNIIFVRRNPRCARSP